MGRLTGTVLLLALCSGIAAAAGERPERVVSINLCADELVLALADRPQIRSVSWLVKDPNTSWSADAARGIPSNHGTATEIVGLNPDLVVAGTYTTPTTVTMLRRLGVPLVELPLPATLEEVRSQISVLATALGQTERGRAIIERMDHLLATLPPTPAGRMPVAAVYHPNGFTQGSGSIIDDILHHAGIANLAAGRGLKGYAALPLETLIMARPDLLIVNEATEAWPSLAHQLLRHPVLASGRTAPITVTVPAQAWSCATANVMVAIERLRAAARDWHASAVP